MIWGYPYFGKPRDRDTQTQWRCGHGGFWVVIAHIPMDSVRTYDSYVEGEPQKSKMPPRFICAEATPLRRWRGVWVGDDDDDDDDADDDDDDGDDDDADDDDDDGDDDGAGINQGRQLIHNEV